MKALCWHGKSDVRVDTVPDPKIEDPRDAIVRITSTCICGSDLHLYNGYMPTMEAGDVLGHEPMGVVEEVGKSVTKLEPGERVVVPFTISCGTCWFCERAGDLFALRQLEPQCRGRPQGDGPVAGSPSRLLAHAGRVPGGQAEYLRVPFADVGPVKIPNGIPDEKVVFLSDQLGRPR